MSSPEPEDVGSGSHPHHQHQQQQQQQQQQPPRSLQQRKPYGSSDSARQQAPQAPRASTDPCTSESAQKTRPTTTADAQSHGTEQQPRPSSPSITSSSPTDPPGKTAPPPAQTPTSPSPSPSPLTRTDLAILLLCPIPTLLHLHALWLPHTTTTAITARQPTTWFALLTLPLSAPLHRCAALPRPARDALQVLSCCSAVTVSADITVALWRCVAEFPPRREWEWLVFCPAVVAAFACWAVVVGGLWACVVVV